MDLRELADSRYVSLTTFRRTGEAVATPVWVARDGEAMVFFTGRTTGKVKRMTRTARVEGRPCARLGAVADDAPVVTGVAEVLPDPADLAHVKRLLAKKYGLEFHLVSLIERFSRRASADRVAVRVTPA